MTSLVEIRANAVDKYFKGVMRAMAELVKDGNLDSKDLDAAIQFAEQQNQRVREDFLSASSATKYPQQTEI